MARLTKKMFSPLQQTEVRLLAKNMGLPLTKLYALKGPDLISFVLKNYKESQEEVDGEPKYTPFVSLDLDEVVRPPASGKSIFREEIGDYLRSVQAYAAGEGDAPEWPPNGEVSEDEPPFDVDEDKAEAEEEEPVSEKKEEEPPEPVKEEAPKKSVVKKFTLKKKSLSKKAEKVEEPAPAPAVDLSELEGLKALNEELRGKLEDLAYLMKQATKKNESLEAMVASQSARIGSLSNLVLLVYNQSCEEGSEIASAEDAPEPAQYL